MRERALNLLGLMRRANAAAIGETNTGSAARAGKARLLLLAADASENAVHRAEGFAAAHGAPLVRLPFTKDEISAHVGVGGCSMAAVTDTGFASAFLKLLAGMEPETYGEAAGRMEALAERARRRREKAETGKRNKRIGKRRNSI